MADTEDQAFQAYLDDLQSEKLTYEEAKRRYLELGDRIKERYEKEVTAVSVDVVESRGAKAYGTPLEAQLTFDNYHRWAEECLQTFGCRASDFTWSGDGLLAIFFDPDSAVKFGKALLDGLPEFNRVSNKLRKGGLVHPLRLRIGAHTGPILPGASPGLGRIASDTVDLAGHLQKTGAPNIMTISQTTRGKLREGAGQFVPIQSEMPNPTTCYAWPPDAAASVPPPTPRPVAPTAPPPPQRATWIPWVVAGAALASLLAVVGVFTMVLPALTGKENGGGILVRTPRVVDATPANGGGGTQAAPITPGVPVTGGTPQTNGTGQPAVQSPPRVSQWEPSRQLWASPDAGSGVPVRLVQSPPDLCWLLAIGVGSYRDRSSFSAPGAGDSARAAAAALQRSAGIPADHVQVLTDGQATLDNIKRGFQWLQQNASSGRDTVYVYLSGDAAGAPPRTGMRAPGGSAYAVIPADGIRDDLPNTALFGADVAAWLGATRAQTVVVFADTPYAGAMDYPTGTDEGRQYAVIAGAGASQRASAERSGTGGPFAEALAVGLGGAADLNRDREISLQELSEYLKGEVARRSGGAQSPEARPGFGGYLPDLRFTAGG